MFIASFSLQSEQQLMVSRDTSLNTSCYIAVMDQYHAQLTGWDNASDMRNASCSEK